MKTFLKALVIAAALVGISSAQAHKPHERAYQNVLCAPSVHGVGVFTPEYRLPDGSRIDCLIEYKDAQGFVDYVAAEVDFANQHAWECVGQASGYAEMYRVEKGLKRPIRAMCALILLDNDEHNKKAVHRAKMAAMRPDVEVVCIPHNAIENYDKLTASDLTCPSD